MSFSNFWENEVLDHLFGKGSYTPPTIYVAVSTTDPGESGATITEPSGANGYARVVTAASDWDTASAGVIDNVNAIIFPTATGDWGEITHVAIYDAASGGNFLAGGTLSSGGVPAPKTVNTGDTLRIPSGAFSVSLD